MSMKAFSWAMSQQVGDPTTKLVLLIICDHFNDSRGFAYPSQERLAEFAECSVRTVRRHIKSLLDREFIEVVATPNVANKYSIPALKMERTKCPTQSKNEKWGGQNGSNGEDTGDLRSLNNPYLISNKLDISENTTKTYGDLVYQDHLQWLATQDIGVKHLRPFMGKLREIIKANTGLKNEEIYCVMDNIFSNVKKSPKADLQSYLIACAKSMNESIVGKSKERVLNDQAKALMESNIQKIYKATHGVAGWGGLDYHEIRAEYEKAFKEGSIMFSHTRKKATADEILKYFGVK